jgi:hypothetical protein
MAQAPDNVLVQNVAEAFHILTDPQALHLHLVRNPILSENQLLHLLGDEWQKRDAVIRTHTLEQVETMMRESIQAMEKDRKTTHKSMQGYVTVRITQAELYLRRIQQMKEQQP